MGLRVHTFVALLGMALVSFSAGGASDVARLGQPVSWGSPDQPYGKRRQVTTADRAAIESHRSRRRSPIFATNFTDPAELQADWRLMSDDANVCRRPSNVEATSGG